MTILVVGGNNRFQHAVSEALARDGHAVRVITTAATSRWTGWPAGIEPVVVEPDSERREDGSEPWRDAARGCDAVIAIDPILIPTRHPERQAPLVERALVSAGRHGARRIVAVTTLQSKGPTTGERKDGSPEWTVIRTVPPYGVDEDFVTLSVILMRSLPLVPVMPRAIIRAVWYEDLAGIIADAATRHPGAAAVTVAGAEAITGDHLYDEIARATDRHPVRVPVNDFVTSYGSRLADALGLAPAQALSHFMAADVDPLPPANVQSAAPLTPFTPFTPFTQGLRRLVQRLGEVTPDQGVGSLQVKTFAAVIRGSAYDATSLQALFRAKFGEVMPVAVGVEPAARDTTLSAGTILTIALPGRGHVSVRVVDVQPTQATVATLRGHAVAGIVRFRTETVPGGVRFEVMTCDRAANVIDWVTLTLGGARVQDANWTTVVTNVVALAGGTTDGVRIEMRNVPEDGTRDIEEEIAAVIRSSAESPADAAKTGP